MCTDSEDSKYNRLWSVITVKTITSILENNEREQRRSAAAGAAGARLTIDTRTVGQQQEVRM